jgi:small subunit ribosomal protein S1
MADRAPSAVARGDPNKKNPMTDQNNSSPLDSQTEKEIAEFLRDQSIEQMMEDSVSPVAARKAKGDAAQGDSKQRRVGTIGAVRDREVIVDFGGKDQGVCPIDHFKKDAPPKVGDRVEFIIEPHVEADGLLRLSLPGGTTKAGSLDALEQGQVIEAMVTGMNTGGLELKVANQRAFMPVSQIELHRVEDLTQYLNKKLRCQIVELNKKKRRIVLSRRAILEVEAAEQRKTLIEALEVGQTLEGTVRNIQKFGAFVELGGGLDGLVHVSDMAWTHVNDPNEVLKVGQKVTVRVLKIDGERISLGLKQTTPDPWETAESKYPVGATVTAKVKRITDFGAFLELEPSVEGLVHISQISNDRIKSVGDALQVGQEVTAKVMQVERPRRRISLSIKALTPKEATSAPTTAEAQHDDLSKYIKQDKKGARAMESLMAKWGDTGGLKGGIG